MNAYSESIDESLLANLNHILIGFQKYKNRSTFISVNINRLPCQRRSACMKDVMPLSIVSPVTA